MSARKYWVDKHLKIEKWVHEELMKYKARYNSTHRTQLTDTEIYEQALKEFYFNHMDDVQDEITDTPIIDILYRKCSGYRKEIFELNQEIERLNNIIEKFKEQ